MVPESRSSPQQASLAACRGDDQAPQQATAAPGHAKPCWKPPSSPTAGPSWPPYSQDTPTQPRSGPPKATSASEPAAPPGFERARASCATILETPKHPTRRDTLWHAFLSMTAKSTPTTAPNSPYSRFRNSWGQFMGEIIGSRINETRRGQDTIYTFEKRVGVKGQTGG